MSDYSVASTDDLSLIDPPEPTEIELLTATVNDLRDGLVTVSQQLAYVIEQNNATGAGVANINQLLGAVQQMALNMPGIKGAAMRAMAGKLGGQE